MLMKWKNLFHPELIHPDKAQLRCPEIVDKFYSNYETCHYIDAVFFKKPMLYAELVGLLSLGFLRFKERKCYSVYKVITNLKNEKAKANQNSFTLIDEF